MKRIILSLILLSVVMIGISAAAASEDVASIDVVDSPSETFVPGEIASVSDASDSVVPPIQAPPIDDISKQTSASDAPALDDISKQTSASDAPALDEIDQQTSASDEIDQLACKEITDRPNLEVSDDSALDLRPGEILQAPLKDEIVSTAPVSSVHIFKLEPAVYKWNPNIIQKDIRPLYKPNIIHKDIRPLYKWNHHIIQMKRAELRPGLTDLY